MKIKLLGKEKTFYLVAPEQIDSSPMCASDVYSVGMMAKDVLRIHSLEIAQELKSIIEKMVEKDIEKRYKNAR